MQARMESRKSIHRRALECSRQGNYHRMPKVRQRPAMEARASSAFERTAFFSVASLLFLNNQHHVGGRVFVILHMHDTEALFVNLLDRHLADVFALQHRVATTEGADADTATLRGGRLGAGVGGGRYARSSRHLRLGQWRYTPPCHLDAGQWLRQGGFCPSVHRLKTVQSCQFPL